ncbi:interferon-induced transmembrane protein 3-like [Tachyglossus aculeatus]|uniref:interferon-induced transmembrane protein 3-like n=1 Tax=Tachyglossus aculeatus TaxID=9261 RepID=UPI0018F46A29|nr:interferon-induced transmembrane protein 3-like [Tachyglossus aculeatus]
MDSPDYSRPVSGPPPGPGPSTVISIPTAVSSFQPRDYLVWSFFNTLYLNFCCLGLIAFIFSVKARDRKVMGDLVGAKDYSQTAKCLNIIAVAACFFSIFICIVITVGIVLSAR